MLAKGQRRSFRPLQLAHYFRLLIAAEGAVGGERRHDAVVPEVLTPRLHGLDGFAGLLAELDQSFAKRVRIEVGQTRPREGFLEDGPDRTGLLPRLTAQTDDPEFVVGAELDETSSEKLDRHTRKDVLSAVR